MIVKIDYFLLPNGFNSYRSLLVYNIIKMVIVMSSNISNKIKNQIKTLETWIINAAYTAESIIPL